MGKRVFMFPGQGSQYIGMGKEFYDTMPNAKAVIDLASEQTGLDIPALCFEENDKLNITEYTQICMLAVEAAIYQAGSLLRCCKQQFDIANNHIYTNYNIKRFTDG